MKRWAIATVAIALRPLLLAEFPPIQPYTVADGLASNQVNQIVADSVGFVWFCTREGLTRFDGHRMISFGVKDGLPHREVNALLETSGGEYLIGTMAGLAVTRPGQGGKFTTYLPGERRSNAITALLQDSSGRIWCGTYGGLYGLTSGHEFRRRPLPTAEPGGDPVAISDLLEDSSHRLWIATRTGIDVVNPDGSTRHIAIEDWTQNVRALAVDGAGRIWAGTQGALILMKSSGEPAVERIIHSIQGTRLDVTSLARGPDGALWAATSTGIARSLPGSGPTDFQMLTREEGLIDRQIDAVAQDRAGNMWAGTEGAGVMQIRNSGFTTFRERDGLRTDRVWGLVPRRNGELVVLTMDESPAAWIHTFDGRRFHALSVGNFAKRPSWGHRILLESRAGPWWGASTAGLCRYAAEETATLDGRQPEICYGSGTTMLVLFEDSKGRIWAAGENNLLLCWDPRTRTATPIEEGPGHAVTVSSFAEDRAGNLWMGSAGVLFRYDGKRFTRFDRTDGIPGGNIWDLYCDHAGRLWMASSNGVGVIENPGDARFQVRIFNSANGLAGDAAGAIVEDLSGQIYISTTRGVDRLNLQTGTVKHFTISDGLAHGEVNMAARDASGNLWFATTQGLSRLFPAAGRLPSPPVVRFTDLRIGRERYPVSGSGETHVAGGDLPPSENQFQVAFVGFNDEPEADLRYTYKLEGADSAWQGPDRNHEVNYADLAPGRYRFLVKAVNSEGRESATAADIGFEILPPVWRRWWFELFAFLAATAAAFWAYRQRLRAVTERVRLGYEERLQERTRIARELHDTLLQNLAGISLQLDGIVKQVGADTQTGSTVRGVRMQVDASFREARQKVQDLRSSLLQGRELPAVLRETAEQIAAGHAVQFRMDVTGSPRRLREDVDEAVLRIAQEAVANAVLHAAANRIQLSLEYNDTSLRLRVEDDGKGFDPEAGSRPGHWGLKNMQERANLIGARWKITSNGRGTTIETLVPASKD
jgi:signal transduction histidine kinase/streptogramin lyase